MRHHGPDSINHLLDTLTDTSTPSLRIHFPTETVSSPGQHLSKSASATPPSFSVSASALKNLKFPNNDLSPVSSHTSNPEDDQTKSPATNEDQDLDTNPLTIPRFLITTLDLDAPFPSFPVLGPILHGMQADLALSTSFTGEDGVETEKQFVPLEHDTNFNRGKDDEGEVARYMGPSPPAWSEPHRYLCLMWQQPEGVTGDRIREEMGWGRRKDGKIGAWERVRFDQGRFEERFGLGEVVAGNYFVC
ncbi:phosphatidylethanolamine-binding protein [Apiosordaria backusii]|uniref:Phosphatidylethanolamine-binding protein n=1 Tax=Apiosordaria backusii TaxID=314023 RepID=A0AA40B2P9_9PEZI|nr:phosphatidylethanolamine-binding protein [Apiosordaria backusii]